MMDESPTSDPRPSSSALPDPLAPISTSLEELTARLSRARAGSSGEELISPVTPAEFWDSCASCCEIVAEIYGRHEYICEGCKCKIYRRRPASDQECIVIWHGVVSRGGPHACYVREHNPDTCKQWVADGRDPVTEKKRKDREKQERML